MSKNYLRAVYNLRRVMNDNKYTDDEKRQYIQQARQSVQDNGINRSSAYVMAKQNLNTLMHNDGLSDDQKRTYILQAMDRLSQNGNPYDVFKEPEEKYNNPYVERYRVKNDKYNPLLPGINGMPKDEYQYDGQLEKANKASNALERSGIEVPKPDEDIKAENANKGGFFTRIFNTLASPFYALNKGIKNISDDDDSTTFVQGAKEGLKDTFFSADKHNDSMVGMKEIINTLRNSQNEFKQATGEGLAGTTGIFRYAKRYADAIKKDKNFAQDFEAQKQMWKQSLDDSEGSSGLVLDLLEPNPLGWLKGVGKGAKLVTKGSEALNVSDKLGGINKAHDVLKTVFPDATRKEAEYLLRKTSKVLGSMEDYKGIRVGTEAHNLQLVSPETLGKIGDYTVAPALNGVRNLMKNSALGESLSKMFVNDTKRLVRKDSVRGLEHMASDMSNKVMQNISSMNKKVHLDRAKDIEKEIYKKSKNGEEMSSILSDAIENKEDIYKSEVVEKLNKNPHYAMELEAERAKRYKEAVDQRVELQKLMDSGKGSEVLESKIKDLDDEIKHLDSLGDYKNYYQGKETNIPYKDLQSGYYQTEGNNISDSLEGFKDEILDKEPSKIIEQKEIPSIKEKTDNITPISKLIEEKKTPVEKIAEEQPLKEVATEKVIDKPITSRPKDIQSVVDKVHELDEKLGKEPTRFVDNLTLEQANNALKKREKEIINDSNIPQELKDKIFKYKENNVDLNFGKVTVDNTTIGKPNGLTGTQKKLLVKEMKKTKDMLPEDFSELRFQKQFGVMNKEDYINEMERLKKIRQIYTETEGTNIAKTRRVQDYIIDTNGKKILDNINDKKVDILRSPSKEQYLAMDKSLKDYPHIEETFRKANEKIDTEIVKHDIPADKLEDVMLDKTAPLKENMVAPLKELERKAYAMKMHDAKWSEDVLKGIKEKRYDTVDKVKNALNSMNEHFKNIPVSEEKGSKQLLKILNNEDYSAFKKLSKRTGSTDMRIYHYNGTKIAIDKNVPPTKVKALFKTLDEAPIETKRILENTNQLNYINSFLSDNALGRATKDSKNITITSKVKKSLMQHILSHEVSHINLKDGNDRANLFKMIRNETTKLVPEELKIVNEAIKKAGLEPAQDIKKYLTSHSEQSGKIDEFLADTCALFLNSSPKVRDVMSKSMPGTKMAIEKMSKEFPTLSRTLPNNNKYKQLKNQLDYYNKIKDTVISGDFTKLDNKINELATNRTVEQMEKVLSDYVPKEPKISTQLVHKITKTGEKIDPRVVEAGLTDLMKSVSKDFSKWASEEEVTQMSNYVTHMLNTELQFTKKGQKTLKKLQETGVIREPKNMFAFQRQHEGTIKAINEVMKRKTGIDNFFETNITKIYLHRALKHEDVMLSRKRFENFMNLFSEHIDHTRFKRMNPAERNAVLNDMQSKIASGEYTVIQKTENFFKKPGKQKPNVIQRLDGKSYAKVTSEPGVEKMLGEFGFHTDNPYIEVNPKRLKEGDLFNGHNDFYLVPTKSFDMYKKTATYQAKENTNALLKAFDKFTNTWKAMAVTSGTFHVNNAVGNMFNSYLEIGANILSPGLNHTARQIQGLTTNGKIKGKFMGKPNTYWAREAEKYGVIGDGFFSTGANSYINGKAKKINGENKLKKLNPLSSDNFVYGFNRKAGNVIEQQARLVNFLHHISTGKTAQEAADLTNKVLFDYGDLTQFEKGTMKRIIPFYTFLRKNAPYQLEQMFNHPERYGKMKIARKDVEKPETEEQKKYKPDYIDDNYVHLGNNKYKDFNLPSQDLEKLTNPKEMIGSLNPLLKLAMELPTNKNIYFDKPIAKDDREKNEKYKKHILQSLVPLANRTGSIPGAFRGDEKDKKNVIGWLTGFKTQEPDLEMAKKIARKKYLNKLQEEETYQWKNGKIKKKEKNPLGQW